MAIPAAIIEQIKSTIEITEVVGWYLNLKKSGTNYWACCPFHNEKSPSFSVSAAKQMYKCFGCGEGGGAINFVMKVDNKTYPEALRFLAEKYHIEIPEEAEADPLHIQAEAERESMFIVLQYAQKFFAEVLSADEEGMSIGQAYFRERGFSPQTIQEFGLGYAKDDWHALESSALKKQYNKDLLEKTGLIVRKEDKTYDRFRGRVMFPIYNVGGKVVAFGARTLKKDDKPKYLNSPESEVYSKSRTLYGLFQAKNEVRKHNNCYLTEGYTDVLALWQAGIKNAVASAGTSLTEEHVQLLKRFTENITLLFDGDPAGIRASLRGVDMLLEQGLNVFTVVLPNNEDPDSYIRKHGTQAMQDALKQSATNFIKFKTKVLLQEAQDDPIKRTEALKSIIASVAKVSDPLKRAVFCKEIAFGFGIDEQIIVAECNKILIKERKEVFQKQKDLEGQAASGRAPAEGDAPSTKNTEKLPHNQDNDPNAEPETTFEVADIFNKSEAIIVQLLLKYGHLIQEDMPVFQYVLEECDGVELSEPVLNKIVMLYKSSIENGEVPKPDYFLQHEDPAIGQTAALLLFSHNLSEKWKIKNQIQEQEVDLASFVFKSLVLFKLRYYQKQEHEHLQELKTKTEPDDVRFHLMVHQEIKRQITHLGKLYGNVLY